MTLNTTSTPSLDDYCDRDTPTDFLRLRRSSWRNLSITSLGKSNHSTPVVNRRMGIATSLPVTFRITYSKKLPKDLPSTPVPKVQLRTLYLIFLRVESCTTSPQSSSPSWRGKPPPILSRSEPRSSTLSAFLTLSRIRVSSLLTYSPHVTV